MKTNEDIFYRLGKLLLVPFLLIFIIMNMIDLEVFSVLPGCLFFKYVHIPCPGCGGTRAVYYLVRGNLVKSFCYHPFVPYAAAVYIAFMGYCFYKRHISSIRRAPVRIERYAYAGVVILLLQFAVKAVLTVAGVISLA